MTIALDTHRAPAPFTWLRMLARADRAIVGARADLLVIYGAPVWSLALIWAFMLVPGAQTAVGFGATTTALAFFVAALTTAHLAPVFVRSHLNPSIFAAHRLKLTLVPPLLFATLMISHWAFIVAGAIAVFWDVYHTAQQNFGLARIYDAKAGDPKGATRTLDRLLCHVMYIGPIMAGASFMEHMKTLTSLDQIGLVALSALPQDAAGASGAIRIVAIVVMALACAGYLAAQWRLARRGHAVSPHKVALMASTIVVQILAWGFSPPAIAFMAINLYHAVQYFGIVWRQEGARVGDHVGVKRTDLVRPVALALIFAAPVLYGLYATATPYKWNALGAAFLSISLLHFWMDGFIWSVRKKTV